MNIIALNLWLAPITSARLDLTKRKDYTLSNVTKNLLRSIDEPLLIRGYFSERTTPCLLPLYLKCAID
ncbi:MAG: Gldg family protein [Myxococcota bacterium]